MGCELAAPRFVGPDIDVLAGLDGYIVLDVIIAILLSLNLQVGCQWFAVTIGIYRSSTNIGDIGFRVADLRKFSSASQRVGEGAVRVERGA